jgi:hypothetical protein
MKDDIDFFTAGDIVQDVTRIKRIIKSDIFELQNMGHPLLKSAFTELMICVNDLTRKAIKYGTRVSFTDDVVVTENIADVTDLIRFIRDALCHSHIYNHFVVPGRIKASFFVLHGKVSHAPFKPDHDIVLLSEYSDDVCFFFGLHKIYLKRHVIRAYREAAGQLLDLLPTFPNDIFIDGSFNL